MLSHIKSPADLEALTYAQLNELSSEIRTFLVEKVSKTGGHLGPNLGVVELTVAIHRSFESPKDVVLFDTGHQSYVHKILTGRGDRFDQLRQRGGISGYCNRAESPHDVIENSHASTALSWPARKTSFSTTRTWCTYLPARTRGLSPRWLTTLVEQGANGQSTTYYRAQVRLDAASANPKLAEVSFKPGMTATVDIRTDSRSVLRYLAKPIFKAFGGAMNER